MRIARSARDLAVTSIAATVTKQALLNTFSAIYFGQRITRCAFNAIFMRVHTQGPKIILLLRFWYSTKSSVSQEVRLVASLELVPRLNPASSEVARALS